jgi:outer membrane receptor for ferric coprogen and ferric-rhodotorulic acid
VVINALWVWLPEYYGALGSSVIVPTSVYGEPRYLMLSVKYSF